MKVREATINDYHTIIEVCDRNGLNLKMPQKKWIDFWNLNPYIEKNPGFSIGWILITDNQLAVGVLINIPIVYELNGDKLLGVAGSSWAVDTQYRKASFLLIMKYFQQKNVDFFINSTSNNASGPVFKAFKAQRVPCLSYDQVLLWIIDHISFAKSVLLKKRIPLVDTLKYPVGWILWCVDKLFGYNCESRISTKIVRLNEFDDRFDVFWGKLRKKENRLLATRDQVTLSWHFHVARSKEEVIILTYLDHDEIVGYLILTMEDNKEINLKRFRIVDLQMLVEKSDRIKDLIIAALQYSKKSGASIVECIGFSGMKRESLEQLSFHRRTLAPFPFYFKTGSGVDKATLNNPALWDPCSYDGDTSLFS
jgi:hypothetical protein